MKPESAVLGLLADFLIVRFGADGEWVRPRILQVQYQNIKGNDLEQFERPGTQVILFPAAYKSGKLQYPLPQQ